MNDFGERLKLVRGNIPQKEFAEKVGFHFNTIGRWERGEKYPTQPDICKILSNYPEINPSWLLTGNGAQLVVDDLEIRKMALLEPIDHDQCDCQSEKRLERRRQLLQRSPKELYDEDFELLEHVFGKIIEFREKYPDALKQEDYAEASTIAYSLCQKENLASGALICSVVLEWLKKKDETFKLV
ncbi:helix-turn-helix domain-containing protein [Desulfobulbus sp.]|uniref:helix-turn-helix domain-containing protein n=1 Tax=Desulfobulbus sp. TaxID=895 RepID=UPI0027B9C996|nr:helix-turn-helix transcriptional regulator [Desulfobulbus sp.]